MKLERFLLKMWKSPLCRAVAEPVDEVVCVTAFEGRFLLRW